jgi:hypothetical protein
MTTKDELERRHDALRQLRTRPEIGGDFGSPGKPRSEDKMI